MLDLAVGNVTVTVSDKTSKSVHMPDDTLQGITKFFSIERTATVFLGGEN